MAEYVQFEPFSLERRWSDEVDLPRQFRELTPEEQADRIGAMSSWAIDAAAKAEAEEAAAIESRRTGVAQHIGERFLAGANNKAFQASVGLEQTFVQLVS